MAETAVAWERRPRGEVARARPSHPRARRKFVRGFVRSAPCLERAGSPPCREQADATADLPLCHRAPWIASPGESQRRAGGQVWLLPGEAVM